MSNCLKRCRSVSQSKQNAYLGWINGVLSYSSPAFGSVSSCASVKHEQLMQVIRHIHSTNAILQDDYLNSETGVLGILSHYYGNKFLEASNIMLRKPTTGESRYSKRNACQCEVGFQMTKVIVLLLNVALTASENNKLHIEVCLRLPAYQQEEIMETCNYLASEKNSCALPSDADWRDFLCNKPDGVGDSPQIVLSPVTRRSGSRTPVSSRRSLAATPGGPMDSRTGSPSHAGSSGGARIYEHCGSTPVERESPLIELLCSPKIRNVAKIREKEAEIQRLKQVLDQKSHTIDVKILETEELKQKLEELTKTVADLHDADSERKRLSLELRCLKDNSIVLREEKQEMETRIEKLVDQLRVARLEVESAEHFVDERNQLTSKVDQLSKTIDRLTMQLDVANAQKNMLSGRLNTVCQEYQIEIDQLLQQCESAGSKNKALQDIIDELQCRNDEATEAHRQIAKYQCALTEAKDSLSAAKMEYDDERAKLKTQIKELGNEILRLESEKANQRTEFELRLSEIITRKDHEQTELNTESHCLKSELINLRADRDRLQAQIMGLKDEASANEAKLERNQIEYRLLIEALEAAVSKTNELESECRRWRNKAEEGVAMISEIEKNRQAERFGYEKSIREQQSVIDSNAVAVMDYETKLERLNVELLNLRSNNDNQRRCHEGATAELRTKIADLQSSLDSERSSHSMDVELLNTKLGQVREECHGLLRSQERQQESYDAIVTGLRDRIRELETQSNEVRISHDIAISQLENQLQELSNESVAFRQRNVEQEAQIHHQRDQFEITINQLKLELDQTRAEVVTLQLDRDAQNKLHEKELEVLTIELAASELALNEKMEEFKICSEKSTAELNQLIEENNQVRTLLDHQQSTYESATKELRESLDNQKLLAEEEKARKLLIEDLMNQLNTSKQEHRTIRAAYEEKLQSQQLQIVDLRQNISLLEAEADRINQSHNYISKQWEEKMQQTYETSATHRHNYEESSRIQREEISALKDRIWQLEAEAQQTQSAHESTVSQLKLEIDQAVDDKSHELRKYQEALDQCRTLAATVDKLKSDLATATSAKNEEVYIGQDNRQPSRNQFLRANVENHRPAVRHHSELQVPYPKSHSRSINSLNDCPSVSRRSIHSDISYIMESPFNAPRSTSMISSNSTFGGSSLTGGDSTVRPSIECEDEDTIMFQTTITPDISARPVETLLSVSNTRSSYRKTELDDSLFKKPRDPELLKTVKTQLNFGIERTESLEDFRSGIPAEKFFANMNDPSTPDWRWDKRLSEMNQRNQLLPRHLKSSYPIETQLLSSDVKDEDLKYSAGYKAPSSVLETKQPAPAAKPTKLPKKRDMVKTGTPSRLRAIMNKFSNSDKSKSRDTDAKENKENVPKAVKPPAVSFDINIAPPKAPNRFTMKKKWSDEDKTKAAAKRSK